VVHGPQGRVEEVQRGLLLCVRDQRFADVGAFLGGARNCGEPKVHHLEYYRSDRYPEAGVVAVQIPELSSR
jgi:hypothetical protein